MEYQKSAGVIVYYQDSKEEIKFLLLKYPSYWGFVKGIIEKDEAEEKTALRELEEETGIKQATLISGFKENQNWFFKLNNKLIKKEAIFFIAKVNEEQAEKVKISSEHEDFVWLNLNEALGKIKIKNNKELLKKAYEFIKKFEAQKTL